MGGSKNDEVQKAIDTGLEKCRDEEFLRNYENEFFITENVNVPAGSANQVQKIQENVIHIQAQGNISQNSQQDISPTYQQLDLFPWNEHIVPAMPYNAHQGNFLNQLQQETNSINTVTANISAKKKLKKLMNEQTLEQNINQARSFLSSYLLVLFCQFRCQN